MTSDVKASTTIRGYLQRGSHSAARHNQQGLQHCSPNLDAKPRPRDSQARGFASNFPLLVAVDSDRATCPHAESAMEAKAGLDDTKTLPRLSDVQLVVSMTKVRSRKYMYLDSIASTSTFTPRR
ncbi:hypothetical protein PHYPSEUDO_008096 [Phytophthora pseudosyringae]|uniref:Uncharacterized protein n=1 Tax=Phytophthora pseudosyringae TaxID=221518 RepID=A0A8T1VI35_9STRA|nr:hypothetical protein PHYPSEUDO_008096 [Phytophthora pseudosyringae]